ncbi:MAG: diguanylate cyclase [Candidatus Theseobacter exili]|nr:diguanylate cyclase [Candidatus Theseobacter exili]
MTLRKFFDLSTGNKNSRLGFKLISLGILISLFLLYLVSTHLIFNEIRRRAKSVAIATATSINSAELNRVRDEDDIDSDSFRYLQSYVQQGDEANSDVCNVFILRKSNDDEKAKYYEYIVDSTTSDKNCNGIIEQEDIFNLPGSKYQDIALSEISNSSCHPTSYSEPSWNMLYPNSIFGFAPVKNKEGETLAIIGIEITAEMVQKKLIRFQFAIVIVWTVLSLLIFILSKFRKMKWIAFIIVSLTIMALFIFMYMIARRVVIDEIRQQAMGVAIATAVGIEADDVTAIHNAKDIPKEEFQNIQKFMARICESNQDVQFIYVMRRSYKKGSKPTDFEYVVDEAELDDNDNGIVDPGEVSNVPGTYYDASAFPNLVKAWYRPGADDEITPDPPYPDLISGYAPIKNKNGRTIGIVGVDIIAETIEKKLIALRTVISIVWLTMSIMAIVILRLFFQKQQLLDEREQLIQQLFKVSSVLDENRLKYKKLSQTDDLTALFNSRHFHYQLVSEMERAKRYNHPLALLMIDIDNFKQINDKFGHQAGDEMLMKIGKTIKTTMRKSDSAYRIGGEEFTVILPETNSDQALLAAERIREECATLFNKNNEPQSCTLTLSIGITLYDTGEDPKALICRADMNMYKAKKQGKNRSFLD